MYGKCPDPAKELHIEAKAQRGYDASAIIDHDTSVIIKRAPGTGGCAFALLVGHKAWIGLAARATIC